MKFQFFKWRAVDGSDNHHAFLSSTIELKMRKRLSIMLCTLDHNHTWHRYSLYRSSYAIAPEHVLRSQCSVKHTALVLTLRLRTRQAMEPGAGTKGIPILVSSAGTLKDDTDEHGPRMRMTYRPEERFTFKREKQTSSILLRHNTYLFHCKSQRIETGNTNFLHSSLLLLLLLLLLAA